MPQCRHLNSSVLVRDHGFVDLFLNVLDTSYYSFQWTTVCGATEVLIGPLLLVSGLALMTFAASLFLKLPAIRLALGGERKKRPQVVYLWPFYRLRLARRLARQSLISASPAVWHVLPVWSNAWTVRKVESAPCRPTCSRHRSEQWGQVSGTQKATGAVTPVVVV